ncbi:MAG: radical SAM protein [Armatimonadota bacterium]
MECPHIPEIRYSEFSKRFHDAVAGERIPISGSIEVTERCNLRCAHCYINQPAGDKEAMARELTYEQWCGIIDQIVDAGCMWLLLTGGEPFVRPDFLDIYTYCKKKGLLITLFTNGTLITPEIADYLSDYCPFSTEITVYGRTKETYERVTGVPGSYERCMRGIELLLERKIPLKLKTMAMTLNVHELDDLKQWAESLGCEFRYDPLLNGRLDGSNPAAVLRLQPEAVAELDARDSKRADALKEFADRFWGAPKGDNLFSCGAGWQSFALDSQARLSPCMLVTFIKYDLRSTPFASAWRALGNDMSTRRRTKLSPCASCELHALCGQCPGFAVLEHGDPEGPVEYLCTVARMRVDRLGLGHRLPLAYRADRRP